MTMWYTRDGTVSAVTAQSLAAAAATSPTRGARVVWSTLSPLPPALSHDSFDEDGMTLILHGTEDGARALVSVIPAADFMRGAPAAPFAVFALRCRCMILTDRAGDRFVLAAYAIGGAPEPVSEAARGGSTALKNDSVLGELTLVASAVASDRIGGVCFNGGHWFVLSCSREIATGDRLVEPVARNADGGNDGAAVGPGGTPAAAVDDGSSGGGIVFRAETLGNNRRGWVPVIAAADNKMIKSMHAFEVRSR